MEAIKVSQKFDCSLDELWNALSNETTLKVWYFPVQNYVFETGKTFSFYESNDSHKYLHECKFLRIELKKIIEHTWTYPKFSKGSSVVKWELFQDGAGTRLQLTHSGIENLADGGPDFEKKNFEMGWDAIVKTNLRNYLYGILKLTFEVEIKAPVEKVWNNLWGKSEYSAWTRAFTEGAYYEGELLQGNRVHLLAPSGEGMYSDILLRKENELLIFKHIGMLKDKKELPLDAESEKWTGCFESYRLVKTENGTKLIVEVDTMKDYIDWMREAFPKALNELKNISENIHVNQ